MTTVRAKDAEKIDALMEKASRALVAGDYFAAERDCIAALDKAFIAGDYHRMARILLPLQEARRQKRDLAFDAGAVYLVAGEIPTGKALKPGCYMVAPPRVGVDGRALREAADHKGVPVVVIVREPTTRDGLWPIVTIGPVTIRTRVAPPKPTPRARKAADAKPATDAPFDAASEPLPSPQWMLDASEALGDAAIEAVPPNAAPEARVEAFLDRLRAHPDHEKLHQRLAEACAEAAQLARPTPGYRRRQRDIDAAEAELEAEGDDVV